VGSGHLPVLLEEAVENLKIQEGDVVIDCTFGRGGHTKRFIEQVGSRGMVVALDVDPAATQAATELGYPNLRFLPYNFRNLDVAMRVLGLAAVDRVFLDLGVSSPQLDEGGRGFSYKANATLDMRLDPNSTICAKTVINGASEDLLSTILWDYGEERWAKRIAEFIVAARATKPIETTWDLVEIIKAAVPKAVRQKEDQHPARRTFQALRIAVNDELGALAEALDKGLAALRVGGRIGCISFHSLEDRMVKQFMLTGARECICPKGLPKCVCGHKSSLKIITKRPIVPTPEEVQMNPRSRSAHLRIAEKTTAF